MKETTLRIGIDIGWSEKQRSCAFAASDPKRAIDWPKRSQSYEAGLYCCRFKLSELLNFLEENRKAFEEYDQVVVVLDGPLGPTCRPTKNRSVDSDFRRGEFRNRMQPSDVDNDAGRTYVSATYAVAKTIVRDFVPWTSGPTTDRITITETNPTVGLALLVAKYDISEIPSRKRPILPPRELKNERSIRAKSDFYWRAGANVVCSHLLENTQIADERNHENVAGLYCLAVAHSLAAGEVISVGDVKSGVYVFPNEVSPNWHSDLENVGISFGAASSPAAAVDRISFDSWNRETDCVSENTLVEEDTLEAVGVCEDLVCEGDREMLVLADNGGVWEKHNDWLEAVAGPVEVTCVKTDASITLTSAKRESQWTASPPCLTLAKMHGFTKAHLSLENFVMFEVRILEMNH